MVFDTWNRKKRMNRKQEWLHFFSICIIIIIYYQGKLIMEKNIFKKEKKKKNVVEEVPWRRSGLVWAWVMRAQLKF